MSERPKVVALPSTGLANDNRQIAALVRRLADEIERGDWGHVDNVVAVVDGAKIDEAVFGRPCTRACVVGLLTYAIHDIMHPDD